MDISRLNVEHDFFSTKKDGAILTLSFKKKPLLHVVDLLSKKILFDFLDLVTGCEEIKVLLIKEADTKMGRSEYIAFYKKMIQSYFDQTPLERMYNAVDQLIHRLMGLNKVVVHVDSGDVILLFMNIGLACDYRIVADNTVFQNPNIELDLVPKGGSVYFLSKMLGPVIASRILLSGKDIKATRARQLGIVDKVVPLKELDQVALETAQSYAQIPSGYAVGIKKLLNYNLNELAGFLDYENVLLRRLTRSGQLQYLKNSHENLFPGRTG